MSRCHYIKDNGQRIFIPGCIGGSAMGPQGCTCPRTVKKEPLPVYLDESRQRRDDREASTRIDHLIVLLDSALETSDTSHHGD